MTPSKEETRRVLAIRTALIDALTREVTEEDSPLIVLQALTETTATYCSRAYQSNSRNKSVE